MQTHLTVGDAADALGTDEWRVRRIVDALPIEIPRAGRYRLIPREHLADIAIELRRRGWTRQAAVDNLAELRDTVTDECPEIWEQAFPMAGKAGRWRTAAGTTVDGAALIASIASGDGNNINPDLSPQFWQVAAGLTGGRRLQSGGWLRGFIDGAVSTRDH